MFGRRDILKFTGASTLGLLGFGGASARALAADKAQLHVGGYAYDRVQAIRDGAVGLKDASLAFDVENIYRLNTLAFGPEKKYEITELGLIPYANKYINEGFRDYTLIPVFISRMFRHSNIYVHVDSAIETPQQLKGKTVATPGYGSSSNTWIRGMLQDEYGVAPEAMQWIETTQSSDTKGSAGASAAAADNGLRRYHLPDDFPLVQGPPGVDESELLLSGGCDALITAITPKAVAEKNPKVRTLFTSPKAVEQAYFRKTGLFPIMHVVAIRKDVAEARPELPETVFNLYTQAKQMAYDNLATSTALRTTLPWVREEYEDTVRLMGEDYWRYGIESNQQELETVMRYIHEQGLVSKHMDYQQMFHPSTTKLVG